MIFEKRSLSLILTLIIAVEIFYFSSIPGKTFGTQGIEIIPIIYHFSVFFLLNFFLLSSLNANKKLKLKYLCLSLFLSLAYTLTDEYHQLFTLGRSSNISDLLTDSLGIFYSTLIYIYINKKSQ